MSGLYRSKAGGMCEYFLDFRGSAYSVVENHGLKQIVANLFTALRVNYCGNIVQLGGQPHLVIQCYVQKSSGSSKRAPLAGSRPRALGEGRSGSPAQ